MKVIFLGTGTSQGVPIIGCHCSVCESVDFQDKRLRTSIYVEIGNTHLIIDTGPDFRQQILTNNIKNLTAILYTHAHKDHTAGLDDIRGFNYIQKKSMPIYAEENVLTQLQKEYEYIFSDHRYPGIPKVEINTLTKKKFKIQNIAIQPIEALHYRLPVLGFRIGDFTYLTDAKTINDAEKKKILGSKVLVLNALQKQPHISHFTFDEALDLIAELQPERAYLTHISHKLGCHRDVEKELPKNVNLAYDGLTLEMDFNG